MLRTNIPLTPRNIIVTVSIIIAGVAIMLGVNGLAFLASYNFDEYKVWIYLSPVHAIVALSFLFRNKFVIWDRYDWLRVLAFTYVIAAALGAFSTGMLYLDSLVWSKKPFFQQIVFTKDALAVQTVLWAIFIIPYVVFLKIDPNNKARRK